jgi:hypothetical protein
MCKKITIFFCLLCTGYVQAQPDTNVLLLNALQGNVQTVLAGLDSFPDQTLSGKTLDFKHKFDARFRDKTENPDYRTSDTALVSVIKIYHRYWDKILLQQESVEQADAQLQQSVGNYLWSAFYQNTTMSHDSVVKNFTDHLEKTFVAKGFGMACGKTGTLYDLLIWAKETPVHYDVELPETKVDVKIVFMDNIVSMGWEEYATFGVYFPGGWATTEQLNCVRSTYDLESESFKVTYLKHEGQHFADYKNYPSLSGADLEYRAKLVELCYADQLLLPLIRFFTLNTNTDRNNAHAFANLCVMRDLTKAVFNQEKVDDLTAWKKVEPKKIHRAARQLLKQNSTQLKTKGKEVKDFIE